MFVIIEALYKDGRDEVDWETLGLDSPDEILAFQELPINLALIEHIEEAEIEGETVVRMASGAYLQLNITKDNLLSLIDMAGLMLKV